MVFCNIYDTDELSINKEVTILILIDGFLQSKEKRESLYSFKVTILILIDGFLQSEDFINGINTVEKSHNPYFNRWFSAIMLALY